MPHRRRVGGVGDTAKHVGPQGAEGGDNGRVDSRKHVCRGGGEEQPEPQRRHAEEEGDVARVHPVVEEDGAVGERCGDEPVPVVGAVAAGDDTGRRARG